MKRGLIVFAMIVCVLAASLAWKLYSPAARIRGSARAIGCTYSNDVLLRMTPANHYIRERGSDCVPELIRLLEGPLLERWGAIHALQWFPNRADESLPALKYHLYRHGRDNWNWSQDARLCVTVIPKLCQNLPTVDDIEQEFAEWLSDPDPLLRIYAAELLLTLNSGHKAASTTLTELLTADSTLQQRYAYELIRVLSKFEDARNMASPLVKSIAQRVTQRGVDVTDVENQILELEKRLDR